MTDFVIRTPRLNAGVIVPAQYIDHPDLSLAAVGFIAFLELHPECLNLDNRAIRIAVQQRFPDVDIEELMSQLLKVGYLGRIGYMARGEDWQ